MMFNRSLWLLATMGMLSRVSGQGAPAEATSPTAHIHWLGLNQVAQETNAAGFMQIWNLPETRRLKDQTLDKLALFLAREHLTNSVPPLTNYHALVEHSRGATLWRPLLEDLIARESCLEVKVSAKGQREFGLALHLDAPRSVQWEADLAAALAATPGAAALPPAGGTRCWQLPAGLRLTLARAGTWTLLGAGDQTAPVLVNHLRERIERNADPFKSSATNFWVEASVDIASLVGNHLADWRPVSGWPSVTLTVLGAGDCIYERARLLFPRTLPGKLDAWELPGYFVQGPISSFSALRGLRPWLEALPAWNHLQAGTPPNQLFAWALEGLPIFTVLAAPQPDATNQVARLAQAVLKAGREFFATNDACKFEAAPGGGLAWKGPPYMAPFLAAASDGQRSFMVGGTAMAGHTNQPLPAELLTVLAATNLVGYAWEHSGIRLPQVTLIGQFARLVAGRAQLQPQSAALPWINAITPKLGLSTFAANQTAPGELSLVRRSSLGLSSLEIHLLADWLESPHFPLGSFSLLTPEFYVEYHLPPPRSPGKGATAPRK